MPTVIPTEPIGSIPRPPHLIEAIAEHEALRLSQAELDGLCDEAVRDTIERFEATGSPVVSDGEQRKAANFAPDGFELHFVDHVRQFPRLVSGPLRYRRRADSFLRAARRHATRPLKQAVIAPSALSLLYPAAEIDGYPQAAFVEHLLDEHEAEVRACLALGAHCVQVDFTEGRLACKLDPSGGVLSGFIRLNNLALGRFGEAELERIGVHTCPGGDRDSTHSADVDYAELLPSLFELKARRFYVALAREADRPRVLAMIREHSKPWQRIFVGVVDPLDARVESPEEVRDRVLEAAEYIPLSRLGTTDDCGFSPFCDDASTSRDTAFEKIRSRVVGTALAAERLAG